MRFTCALYLLIASSAACTTYQIQQSSLVPPPVMPMQPAEKLIVDAYVGDATVTFLSEPRRASGDQSALWVSRHVMQGAATVYARYVGFRLTGLMGLPDGAMRASPGSLARPDEVIAGWGAGVVLAVPFEAHAITSTLDIMLLDIPSRFAATCVAGCENAGDVTGVRRGSLLQPSFSIGYAYELSPIARFFFAFAFAEHPTNQERFDHYAPATDLDLGPLYVTAGLGAELRPIKWLGIVPLVQLPLMSSPIEYGPFIGLGLRGMVPGDIFRIRK